MLLLHIIYKKETKKKEQTFLLEQKKKQKLNLKISYDSKGLIKREDFVFMLVTDAEHFIIILFIVKCPQFRGTKSDVVVNIALQFLPSKSEA